MLISQVHVHTLPSIPMIIPTPRQMEINLVHQSVAHTHTYTLFNTHDNTDATADGVTSCSSIRHTHTITHSPSRSLKLKIIQTPRQMTIHHVNQSGTRSYTPFNTHDNTDATADGNKSSSSVSCTHTYTLSLILMIIHTPRQMEINLVPLSGTHTHTLSL